MNVENPKKIMRFFIYYPLSLLAISTILIGCTEQNNLSFIQKLISDESIQDGYQPFSDINITEVCFLEDGIYEGKYNSGKSFSVNPKYDHMTILIKYKKDEKYNHINSNIISHLLPINTCFNNPQSIEIRKNKNTSQWNFYLQSET